MTETDSTRALFVLITMQNAGETLTSGHDLTVCAGSRTHDLLTYVLTERIAPAHARGRRAALLDPSGGDRMTDLETYRQRVRELRGQGLSAVAASRTAMAEALTAIHAREEAWHDATEPEHTEGKGR